MGAVPRIGDNSTECGRKSKKKRILTGSGESSGAETFFIKFPTLSFPIEKKLIQLLPRDGEEMEQKHRTQL